MTATAAAVIRMIDDFTQGEHTYDSTIADGHIDCALKPACCIVVAVVVLVSFHIFFMLLCFPEDCNDIK